MALPWLSQATRNAGGEDWRKARQPNRATKRGNRWGGFRRGVARYECCKKGNRGRGAGMLFASDLFAGQVPEAGRVALLESKTWPARWAGPKAAPVDRDFVAWHFVCWRFGSQRLARTGSRSAVATAPARSGRCLGESGPRRPLRNPERPRESPGGRSARRDCDELPSGEEASPGRGRRSVARRWRAGARRRPGRGVRTVKVPGRRRGGCQRPGGGWGTGPGPARRLVGCDGKAVQRPLRPAGGRAAF